MKIIKYLKNDKYRLLLVFFFFLPTFYCNTHTPSPTLKEDPFENDTIDSLSNNKNQDTSKVDDTIEVVDTPLPKDTSIPITIQTYFEITDNSVLVPFDIGKYFVPSGFMGDGEDSGYVFYDDSSNEGMRDGDIDGQIIKITYKKGKKGWAGISWQYPENNWGDTSGKFIIDAHYISFYAKGNMNSQVITIQVGNDQNSSKKYSDSFKLSQQICLTTDWQKHSIDLRGYICSNIINGFMWIATLEPPADSLIFYLDQIEYR